MADGKFFTEETKGLIVQAGDDALKLPFYLEPFDGLAIKVVVNFVDSKADAIVPDEIDGYINEAIISALKGDTDNAAEKAATALSMVIDLPLLTKNNKQQMFADGLKLIIRFVIDWIEKKKISNQVTE